MDAATNKLAAALRDTISALSAPGAPTRTEREAIMSRCRAALAEHDAQASDPVRALVLRAALENYSSAQYREAKRQRAKRMAVTGKVPEWAERNAQACDARRRVADAMLADHEIVMAARAEYAEYIAYMKENGAETIPWCDFFHDWRIERNLA